MPAGTHIVAAPLCESNDLIPGEGGGAGATRPSPLHVGRANASPGSATASSRPSDAAPPGVERDALEPGDAELGRIDPYSVVIDPHDEVGLEIDDSAGTGLNVRESFVPLRDPRGTVPRGGG